MVESQPSKLLVASSILVSRSMFANNLQGIEFHGCTPITPFSFLTLPDCQFQEAPTGHERH
jgi:hypothetical protein